MGYKNAAYLKGNPFSMALHINPGITRFTAPAYTRKKERKKQKKNNKKTKRRHNGEIKLPLSLQYP